MPTGTYSHLSTATQSAFLGLTRSIFWGSPAGEGQQLDECRAAQARPDTTQGACCLYKTANKAGYHPSNSCLRCQWPCGKHSKAIYTLALLPKERNSAVGFRWSFNRYLATNVEQSSFQKTLKYVWIKVKHVFVCCPRSYPLQSQGLCLERLCWQEVS